MKTVFDYGKHGTRVFGSREVKDVVNHAVQPDIQEPEIIAFPAIDDDAIEYDEPGFPVADDEE